MKDHVYKHIELTGTSSSRIEEAIQNAINKAGSSVRNMRWFEMVELRGAIEDQKVVQYQATIKVGFTIEN